MCSFISHVVFYLSDFLQVLGHYIRRQQDPETFIKEIKFIASDPDDKYFFNVTDEAALNDIVDALGDRIFTLEGDFQSTWFFSSLPYVLCCIKCASCCSQARKTEWLHSAVKKS